MVRKPTKKNVRDISDLEDVYYDMLVFFSPGGIESLFKNFPDFKQNTTAIAAFGRRNQGDSTSFR